jgi:hypothetical protein
MSPNDCREETGWPRSGDATADSIEPPVAGGKSASVDDPPTPAPPPSDDGGDKIARLDQRRSRHATTEPEVDLASPEFMALRGVLARAFLKHRASMGLGDASDEWILAHVDDMCLVLSALTDHAIAIDDRPWLQRHIWWRLLSYQLRNELPAASLDS